VYNSANVREVSDINTAGPPVPNEDWKFTPHARIQGAQFSVRVNDPTVMGDDTYRTVVYNLPNQPDILTQQTVTSWRQLLPAQRYLIRFCFDWEGQGSAASFGYVAQSALAAGNPFSPSSCDHLSRRLDIDLIARNAGGGRKVRIGAFRNLKRGAASSDCATTLGQYNCARCGEVKLRFLCLQIAWCSPRLQAQAAMLSSLEQGHTVALSRTHGAGMIGWDENGVDQLIGLTAALDEVANLYNAGGQAQVAAAAVAMRKIPRVTMNALRWYEVWDSWYYTHPMTALKPSLADGRGTLDAILRDFRPDAADPQERLFTDGQSGDVWAVDGFAYVTAPQRWTGFRMLGAFGSVTRHFRADGVGQAAEQLDSTARFTNYETLSCHDAAIGCAGAWDADTAGSFAYGRPVRSMRPAMRSPQMLPGCLQSLPLSVC
jgi:hypothetical protein